MLTITLKFNDTVLNKIETDKELISIGRNPSNDIHIDNLSVSKKHARIIKKQGEYFIEDLNSTNGTYVNEIKINSQKLNREDMITIGKHTLNITLPVSEMQPDPQADADDTMLLSTQRHKQMLEKQKKK